MKSRDFFIRTILVIGFGASLWCGAQFAGAADSAASYALAVGKPAFLQQSGASAWTPAGSPPTARGHLPSSAMPHVDAVCSVDTSDVGSPPTCSSGIGFTQVCSAHCDTNQECSAFSTIPPGQATCSTHGNRKTVCSVLQPPSGPPGNAACSAFNDFTAAIITCSVMARGVKQFCSSENPSFTLNTCSAMGTVGPQATCSVISGGPLSGKRNFCTTFRAGIKNCSVYSAGKACSVQTKGICTLLGGATVGTCSSFAAGAHCSVLGGAPGVVCRIP